MPSPRRRAKARTANLPDIEEELRQGIDLGAYSSDLARMMAAKAMNARDASEAARLLNVAHRFEAKVGRL